jgi:hypothetical protein
MADLRSVKTSGRFDIRSDDAAQFLVFLDNSVPRLIAATAAPALPKSEIGHRQSPLPNKDPQYP